MAPSNLPIISCSLKSQGRCQRSLTLGHIQRGQVTPKEQLLSLADTPPGPALVENLNASVRRSSCSSEPSLGELRQSPRCALCPPGTQGFLCISCPVLHALLTSLRLLPHQCPSPLSLYWGHSIPPHSYIWSHLSSRFPSPLVIFQLFAAFLLHLLFPDLSHFQTNSL